MKSIVLRSYDNYIEAHLAAGQLESEGINAYLHDEFSVTINPVLTGALGGIKLLVSEHDAIKAHQILEVFDNNRKAKQTCPKCGSGNVQYIVPPDAKNWLVAVVSFSLSNLAMGAEKKYHCFECGFEFEEIRDAEAEN